MQPFLAVPGDIDSEMLSPESTRDFVRERHVVLDQQDFHEVTPNTWRESYAARLNPT
jgi:hypothetical protein